MCVCVHARLSLDMIRCNNNSLHIECVTRRSQIKKERKKFSVEEAICERMIEEILALKWTAMKKRGVNL